MGSRARGQVPRGALLRVSDVGLLRQFEDHLKQGGFVPESALRYSRGARHFVVWLRARKLELEAIDDAVIRRFRDHRCKCPSMPGWQGRYKRHAKPTRFTMCGAIHFVQFLEDTRRTFHHDEVKLGFRLLQQLETRYSAEGYPPRFVRKLSGSVRHLVVWLHRSRIRLCALSPDVVQRFAEHDCVCPITTGARNRTRRGSEVMNNVERFARFLAELGVAPMYTAPPEEGLPVELVRFRTWLQDRLNLADSTIRGYLRIMSKVLPRIGTDPELYDAPTIRDAFLCLSCGLSASSAANIGAAIRSYLRYCAATGRCRPGLDAAIPCGSNVALSSLPRYISDDAVERVVSSCDLTTSIGIRDRSVLLFLARLGLRAGDLVRLQLSDFEWKKAMFSVTGKSRTTVRLPLPQDVGEALLMYLDKARPRVNEPRVFLRANPPFRPFAGSTAIVHIVHRALERAEVVPPPGAAAHVFRHSLATSLLRSGTSLEAIGAILRHGSLDSTMIYAKVDRPMLMDIAEPWIGAAQ